MKPICIAVAAVVGLAFTLPVDADHGCNGTVTEVEAGPHTFYLDDRSTKTGERDHWLYLESNGIEGLQSGGKIDLLQESLEPEITDPCAHYDADRLLLVNRTPWI